MDQDTRTYAPTAADLTAHCGARDDGYICTATAGHAPLDHAAYESDLDTQPVHTWPAAVAAMPAEQNEMAPPEPSPADIKRAAVVAGFRQLAGWLEAHPEIPLPYDGPASPLAWFFYGTDAAAREGIAAVARAFPGPLAKEVVDYADGESRFRLTGSLAGVKVLFSAERDAVCTITGYEDREVEETVTPAVKRTITKPMPVWECAPILAAQPAASAE